jgi:hypothetical protein
MADFGRTKILRVPYLVQPDPTWCQSTVLKMIAMYIEQSVLFASFGGADRKIADIWKDINTGTARPQQVHNSLTNMKWWLQSHYPRLNFRYQETRLEDVAVEKIVGSIDAGFPVLVSVSHSGTHGHIILVIGYENYRPNMSSAEFQLVVNDPYGRFDPSLAKLMFGSHRFDGGSSLPSGDERGPGSGNRIPVYAASRRRADDQARGIFRLITCRR